MNEEIKKEEGNEGNKEPNKIGANRQSDGTFGAGNIANPEGRPKGTYSMITILKRKLAEVIKEKGIEKGEELVDVWIEKGGKEFEALKEIIHYTDGMPKQNLQLGIDETIGEVKISIKKNEDSKSAGDNSLPEELGAVPEEGKENNP